VLESNFEGDNDGAGLDDCPLTWVVLLACEDDDDDDDDINITIVKKLMATMKK
jgi:hypothetical protein